MMLTRPHACQGKNEDESCRERARVWVTKENVNKNLCWVCQARYIDELKWKRLNW